jgi:hypothetical protein
MRFKALLSFYVQNIMWALIFQIVLCIFIIWIGHSLWNYFLHKFSKEKTRDLVNIHTEKYKNIIEELSQTIQNQTQMKELEIDMQTDLEQLINEMNSNSNEMINK